MDAKVTLSFDKQVIERAKKYAEKHNMSLSRLMEMVLDKITSNQYASIEDFPVSDWVMQVAEGPLEYTRKKKSTDLKSEYRSRKKTGK
ncbi:MAG TPA: DUF6364 family protein [Flavobacteriales bacterium]|nr:DUF6364 family protein [Flavobacteriales bacterium]